MLIESFEHAEADFEARLLIEARNEAETVILATEKSLRRPDFEQVAAESLEAGERRRSSRRWPTQSASSRVTTAQRSSGRPKRSTRPPGIWPRSS